MTTLTQLAQSSGFVNHQGLSRAQTDNDGLKNFNKRIKTLQDIAEKQGRGKEVSDIIGQTSGALIGATKTYQTIQKGRKAYQSLQATGRDPHSLLRSATENIKDRIGIPDNPIGKTPADVNVGPQVGNSIDTEHPVNTPSERQVSVPDEPVSESQPTEVELSDISKKKPSIASEDLPTKSPGASPEEAAETQEETQGEEGARATFEREFAPDDPDFSQTELFDDPDKAVPRQTTEPEPEEEPDTTEMFGKTQKETKFKGIFDEASREGDEGFTSNIEPNTTSPGIGGADVSEIEGDVRKVARPVEQVVSDVATPIEEGVKDVAKSGGESLAKKLAIEGGIAASTGPENPIGDIVSAGLEIGALGTAIGSGIAGVVKGKQQEKTQEAEKENEKLRAEITNVIQGQRPIVSGKFQFT